MRDWERGDERSRWALGLLTKRGISACSRSSSDGRPYPVCVPRFGRLAVPRCVRQTPAGSKEKASGGSCVTTRGRADREALWQQVPRVSQRDDLAVPADYVTVPCFITLLCRLRQTSRRHTSHCRWRARGGKEKGRQLAQRPPRRQ